MASDLSGIFKSELTNTLEQLLSKSSSVSSVNNVSSSDISDTQFVETKTNIEFKNISSSVIIFTPTSTATKLEYFMLGGIADLKEHIDDEITDAVGEIVSNVFGSFSTSVNAQGFDDIGNIKCENQGSLVVELSSLDDIKNIIELELSLDDDKIKIFLGLDEIILPYFDINSSGASTTVSNNISIEPLSSVSSLGTEIITEAPTNLDMLYDVKLRLSVRLGTKVVLLKDILTWDVGEIIELEQMVNEPLEILVNGVKIGEGEAVVVEGKFGLKVKKIGKQKLRLK